MPGGKISKGHLEHQQIFHIRRQEGEKWRHSPAIGICLGQQYRNRDFLFAKVMSDKEICIKVLETILGVSIREVSMPATQKTINMLYDGKSIRLNIYLNDDVGTVYNVKMERGKHKKAILPKRSRYYLETLILTSSPQAKITGK